MSKVVALDTHSLIYRSYYAGAKYNSSCGFEEVMEVFSRQLSGMLRSLGPEYVLAAADAPGGNFRSQLAPDYKAGRSSPDQLKACIPQIIKALEDIGIPVYQEPGYEADDVLASLASKIKDGHQLVLITSDRDLAALVNQNVKLFLMTNKGPQIYSHENAHQIFGVSPERIANYKALAGDSSDNIPGVPGIGPQGAIKILEVCECFEELEHKLDLLPKRLAKLISENLESMHLSHKLAQMKIDAPCLLNAIEAHWSPAKLERLEAYYKKPDPQSFFDF